MTLGGWIMMLVAWVGILWLTAWCIAKVIRGGAGDFDDRDLPPVVPTA